jgi:hypothetical protein
VIGVGMRWLGLQDSPIKAFSFLKLALFMRSNTLLQCLIDSQFH